MAPCRRRLPAGCITADVVVGDSSAIAQPRAAPGHRRDERRSHARRDRGGTLRPCLDRPRAQPPRRHRRGSAGHRTTRGELPRFRASTVPFVRAAGSGARRRDRWRRASAGRERRRDARRDGAPAVPARGHTRIRRPARIGIRQSELGGVRSRLSGTDRVAGGDGDSARNRSRGGHRRVGGGYGGPGVGSGRGGRPRAARDAVCTERRPGRCARCGRRVRGGGRGRSGCDRERRRRSAGPHHLLGRRQDLCAGHR